MLTKKNNNVFFDNTILGGIFLIISHYNVNLYKENNLYEIEEKKKTWKYK